MSTVPFRRPARRPGPEMPHGEIDLQEPPSLPEPQPAGLRSVVMIVPTVVMSGMMVLLYSGSGSMGGGLGIVVMVMLGLSVLAALGAQMMQSGGDRRGRVAGERRDYLRHLAQARGQVRGYAQEQQRALAWRHPDPHSLWSLATTSRLWERRPTHPDFGELRVGTGPQRLAVRIAPMTTKPVTDLEPVSAKAVRRFTRAYTTLLGQPVAIYVRGFAHVAVQGDPGEVRALVRALLAQLAALHAPDEVRVAICASPEQEPHWAWVKWLPHAQHPVERDAAGPVRQFGESLEDIERLLGPGFAQRSRFDRDARPSRDEPFVVVLSDGGRIAPGARFLVAGYANAVLIEIGACTAGDRHTLLRLDVTADDVEMVDRDRIGRETRTRLAAPDRLSEIRAAALARVIARHTAGTGEPADEGLTANLDLPDLLGIASLEDYDPRTAWPQRTGAARLRVPIGVAGDGSPIELDIKESAEGGMGPHGMLIGATGSGKSELLRTLVLGLASTHSPETLNFVLVDFKGGATFFGLERLPHVSALITNLADEAGQVDRMRDALHGELVRRQEILRRAGAFSSVRDYEQARAQGSPLEPLPTLFVVVDEFSELIAAHGHFIDLFVMIGRLGRSLAVHLLLASQRLDDGRIHQLEGHLSYRIGLRTFSSTESRSVIGVPDAYELPPAPGNGYLRSDVATLTRFRAAYVSGPHLSRSERSRPDVIESQVLPYGTTFLPPVLRPEAADADAGSSSSFSVMEVLIGRLVDHGPPAHRVWLPPLTQPPSLDQVLPPLLADAESGLRAVSTGERPFLSVPVGMIDKPFEQICDLLVVDLTGVGGNLGIAGGPQSGKSTLLRSLIAALALTHSPSEIQFYCLDFGGGSMTSLAGLPHVGDVTGRHDPDRVNRTVAEVMTLLVTRERRFADLGITGMASLRERRTRGLDPEELFGDVFLVVDGWFTLRQDFEAAEETIRELATRGLNYGIHVLLTAGRWSEIHSGMRDKIGSRLELRLGDPVESGIDLRAAAQVPKAPGRGLTDDKLHFIGALPRIDGEESAIDLERGVEHLVNAVSECWSGPSARAVRTLPAMLPAAALPAPEGALRLALGVDESDLGPVWHDFRVTPHLTVLGDTQSGKTNLLRLVAQGITATLSPREARILAIDQRRELFDVVPAEYRIGYGVSADTVRAGIGEAVSGLKHRVPDAEVTPDQLRRRDWWSGPVLFVLVDDYDLLAGHDSPLAPLIDLLPHGADIGLHLVVTRGAAGLMRLSMDPVLRRVQELNTPELALSCPPAEGPLLGGVKARHFPPGRALLCTRRSSRLVQTALVEAVALDTASVTSAT